MRETLGPFAASLTQARRRRAFRILVAGMIAVFGLIAWSNYPGYRGDRKFLTKLERGQLAANDLFRYGYTCDGASCQFIGRDGQPFGPRIPIEPQANEPTPGEKPAPGEQSGNFFTGGGPPITREDLQRRLPEIIPGFRAQIAQEAKALSARTSLQARARSLGTFWGVLFAALIAATLIGAEWRWGVWRTLLTHEPRRGRVLVAKFATVWTMILLAFAIVYGVTAGLDAIFRSISSVGAGGGASTLGVVRSAGKALLSVEVYATFSAALTMIVRTSFAGVGALALLLADGLASQKWTWLRQVLPTQQIARLIPPAEGLSGSHVWFPLATSGKSVCKTAPEGFQYCREVPLPPVPQWRAVAVLFGWMLLAAIVAWLFVRARDVPQ